MAETNTWTQKCASLPLGSFGLVLEEAKGVKGERDQTREGSGDNSCRLHGFRGLLKMSSENDAGSAVDGDDGRERNVDRNSVEADMAEMTPWGLEMLSSRSLTTTLERVEQRKRSREEKRKEMEALAVAEKEADAEGVDWEDVQVDWNGGGRDEDGQEEAAEEVEEDTVIEIQREVDEVEPATKTRKVGISAGERRFFTDLHVSHLVALVASVCIRGDSVAADERVQSAAVKLLAEWPLTTLGNIRRVFVSLATTLKVIKAHGSLESNDLVTNALLAAEKKIGTRLEIAVLVTGAIRAKGFRARVVASLWPLSHKPRSDDFSPADRMRVWCEIFYMRRWIPVCASTGAVDAPSVVVGMNPQPKSGSRSRSKPKAKVNTDNPHPSHVVACESGRLRDVTMRYTAGWQHANANRAPRKVFEQVLENLTKPQEGTDSASEAEKEEFERIEKAEPLPTAQAAYVNHPRFVLEKHLNKFEILHPKGPILGVCSGLPVYPRSNVQVLRSRERWVREMRVVQVDAEPVRTVDARKGSSREGEAVELFGRWQTDPYIVPAAVDGIVPKDERGRVEIWTPAHVPRGCVHINLKYAVQMARKLGIDFAVAMTGFDVQQGKSIPRIEGAVVCVENKGLIEDAARAGMGARIEVQAKKAFDEIVGSWRRVIRAVRAKEKVRRKYGGMLDHDLPYLKAKKMGIEQRLLVPERTEKEPETAPHQHEFSEPAQDPTDRDMYVKACLTCGFEYRYEKI